jgi:hypothetical protein
MHMKVSDRRLAQRFCLTIPLHIREWKSQLPAQESVSVNVSEHGVYFETDTPPGEGAVVQIRLEMPEEVTGIPPVEWLCTGKVTRLHPPKTHGALVGVSVRFDCYEVLTPENVHPDLTLSHLY